MNTIKYSLALQSNPANPDETEKAYARVQRNEVISTKQFIYHISEMFICYFVCLFVPSFRNNYHIRNLILI